MIAVIIIDVKTFPTFLAVAPLGEEGEKTAPGDTI